MIVLSMAMAMAIQAQPEQYEPTDICADGRDALGRSCNPLRPDNDDEEIQVSPEVRRAAACAILYNRNIEFQALLSRAGEDSDRFPFGEATDDLAVIAEGMAFATPILCPEDRD